MGLLFPFAVTLAEKDRVSLENENLTVKTYGLPFLFWGYLAAILSIMSFMYLAIAKPLAKFYKNGELPDQILAVLIYLFFILIPVVLLGFFFYEKILIKKSKQLIMVHKIFYIPFFTRKFELTREFSIDHFSDSPNMAAKLGYPAAFKNRGYFYLHAQTDEGIKRIDRHSQKGELKKLKLLLERF